MKCTAAAMGCLLFGCLNPVVEGVDAGVCRESLGLADVHKFDLEVTSAGEHRDGRYFFGLGQLLDAQSLKRVEDQVGVGPAVWPCTGATFVSWRFTQQDTFLYFSLTKNRRAYSLLYEYTDQLQAQVSDACLADGGFGPTAVLLDLPPVRARDDLRFAGIAKTDSGFLACSAQLDDAGVVRDMILYRADDGGVISSVPSSADHCGDLRPPLALTWSGDGGRELINFETRRGVSTLMAGGCRLALGEAALCSHLDAATLVWGQGARVLVREEGAAFLPTGLTARDRQYVRRVSADGGHGWYWFRDGALELLDEGMPLSSIGDFDDQNIFYIVQKGAPDGGNQVEFVRRCLPK